MSSYGSGSPREGDMDCYEPQFYCSGRPQYHSMQELHCQISSADGLHSPACHPALSEDDLSGPNEAYWRPQNGGASTPIAMGSFNGFGSGNLNGGYATAQYGYDEPSHHMMSSSSPSADHYHQNQLYHFNNHYLSASTPTLPMDCDRSLLHHNQRQENIDNTNGSGVAMTYNAQAPNGQTGLPFVRVVKRRNTANKKERRRTQSINTAFADLRECIPNVPVDTKLSKVSEQKAKRRNKCINEAFSHLKLRIPNVPPDTKLSKIKTLRLATSYISYLMAVLESDAEPAGGFRAELPGGASRRNSRPGHSAGRPRGTNSNGVNINNNVIDNKDCVGRTDSKMACDIRSSSPALQDSKRSKGRTGWPQHVWALELKQEQNL